jgi:hypothetical protein
VRGLHHPVESGLDGIALLAAAQERSHDSESKSRQQQATAPEHAHILHPFVKQSAAAWRDPSTRC